MPHLLHLYISYGRFPSIVTRLVFSHSWPPSDKLNSCISLISLRLNKDRSYPALLSLNLFYINPNQRRQILINRLSGVPGTSVSGTALGIVFAGEQFHIVIVRYWVVLGPGMFLIDFLVEGGSINTGWLVCQDSGNLLSYPVETIFIPDTEFRFQSLADEVFPFRMESINKKKGK